MLSTAYCCKDVKKGIQLYSRFLHFHSKIPLIVAFSKPPASTVSVNFIFTFTYWRSCIFKENYYFSSYLWGKAQPASYPSSIISGTVSRGIFTIIMDSPTGEEIPCHTWYYFEWEECTQSLWFLLWSGKKGNVFFKYSQRMDYCFSCGQGLFTNVFAPNNTHLPMFTFISQQKTFTRVPSSLRSVVLASFFGGARGGGGVYKVLKSQDLSSAVSPKASLAVSYIYTT